MPSLSLLIRDQDRSLWAIIAAVLIGHILFLSTMAIQFESSQFKPTPPRRVVARTITLQPKETKPATAAKPSTQEPKKALPSEEKKEIAPVIKKVEAPVVKKTTAKSTAKAEPKPTPSPAKQDEKLTAKRESISKIQESLSKIHTTSLKEAPKIDLPSELVALAVDDLPEGDDAAAVSAELHYRDELGRRLRRFLKLPEHGEVVIKLTLDRSGNFVRMSIVSAVSQANKKYVEQKVPDLSFPQFGVYFGGENQHTFTVALRSES